LGGSESSGISWGRVSEGDTRIICCERTFFALAAEREVLSLSDDFEESPIVYALQSPWAEACEHCLARVPGGVGKAIEAEGGTLVLHEDGSCTLVNRVSRGLRNTHHRRRVDRETGDR
jgi:hypothetical protein